MALALKLLRKSKRLMTLTGVVLVFFLKMRKLLDFLLVFCSLNRIFELTRRYFRSKILKKIFGFSFGILLT